MPKIDTLELDLYSHWACSLINADDSGLEDDDLAELNAFVDTMVRDHGQCICVDVSEDHWFGMPDYGCLPGDTSTFTFHI